LLKSIVVNPNQAVHERDDRTPTLLRELIELGPSAAPAPSEPRRLLAQLLGPARDAEAPPRTRVDAYRLLLLALEGSLLDHDFAVVVRREWMACGVHRGSRGRQRLSRPPSRSARR
jgi:hypothetical protein